MSFIIDKQTLSDLHIFGKGGRDGIYHLFQQTRTRGGAELLENMFRYPLANAQAINNRSAAIQYLQQAGTAFPFEPAWFDAAEQYLANHDERSKLRRDGDTMGRKLHQLVGADTHYHSIVTGLSALHDIVLRLYAFTETIAGDDAGTLLQAECKTIRTLLQHKDLAAFQQEPIRKSDYARVAALDQLIRFGKRETMHQLLHRCYWLDVHIAVAIAARQHGFAFARATDHGDRVIHIEGLYHPLVAHAVSNDCMITADNNIIFLTGANMAGKSTFMKSTGIALYLAHVGFPVPARAMQFAVRDGLLTSINLADNLSQGYSHFYAEVLRVKQVSEHLARGHNLFVIFDELFRGTNVKDAYDATVAITEAYSRHPNCMFVVSTHIIEAADVLKQRCRNIQYLFLPTIMEGTTPRYTYQLREGVTADRHGLVIINQEGIPDILAAGQSGKNTITPAAAVFYTDQQTLQDLNLTGKYKSKSIFSLFNETVTAGGEQLLEQYFRAPLTDPLAINARSDIFNWFSKHPFHFPVDPALYSAMAQYLRTARAPQPGILFRSLLRRSRFLLGVKEEYLLSMEGLRKTLNSLAVLRVFLLEGWPAGAPVALQAQRDLILATLEDNRLAIKKAMGNLETLTWKQALHYEKLLQGELHPAMEVILDFLHALDVYIAVGNTARKKGLTRAMAYPKEKQTLILHEAWHPALDKAVANDLHLDSNSNLLFLTGANMAGKSTIMKTLGVCCYLAHMGFPVPARNMDFSVMEGVYTSINVPDNLDKGYSHFYAEVVRIKKVAEALASGQQLLIIFDELFKGTNVKDAYDATLMVSQALTAYTRGQFVISTHIVEVGHALQQQPGKNIQFRYMPTEMQGTLPHYPYRMAQGISNDRHGMLLLNNEHVLDILHQSQEA